MDEKRITRDRMVIGCLLLMFVIVLGAVTTMAWFKADSTNTLHNMQMEGINNLFELRTGGVSSNYSGLLTNETFGYAEGSQVDDGLYKTDGSNNKIVLRLISSDDGLNGGLQPGDRGSFSFTIVPNSELADDEDHELHVQYKISVKGYYLSAEKKEAIMICEDLLANDETPTAEQTQAATVTYEDLNLIDGITPGNTLNDSLLEGRDLINGHVLFFNTLSNSKYSNRITLSENMEKTIALDETETVTINWIWPETFADIVDEDNTILLASERTSMAQYIASNEGYFFSRLQKSRIEGLNNNSLTSSAVLDGNNYIAFSAGYNNADQVIGECVQYVLIEISADGYLADKE